MTKMVNPFWPVVKPNLGQFYCQREHKKAPPNFHIGSAITNRRAGLLDAE
jgi:hypothetical protein